MVSEYTVIKWLFIQVMEERSRWFLWSPVLFGIGVSVFFGLTWQPDITALGYTVLIGVLFFLPAIRNQQFLFTPVLVSLIVSLGFNAGLIRELSVAAPVLQKKSFTELSGLVIEKSAGLKKKRLILTNLSFEREGLPKLSKIRLTIRSDISHIKPGQLVSLKAVLLPPPPPAYPGAYDFQRDSYFKKIGAVGYSISPVLIVNEIKGNEFQINHLSAKLRDLVNTYVSQNAPADTAGFSIAIMSGDRQALSKKQIQEMRQSGLAHLLAISGLHMGMVGGLIFFAVRLLASCWPRVALTYPIKKWAAVIALMGLTGYLLVSGMSVSALRAYLMISMVFIAVCFDRTALSLRNIALAALLILLFLPESLLTASFQMSFAAVFCLIAVYERFGVRLLSSMQNANFVKRIILYLAGVVFTSLIASAATAPFAIFHFGQFALLGLLANLIAVPLMGFWVMPWTLVAFLLMPVFETSIALDLAGAGIEMILKIAHVVSSLPNASLQLGTYPESVLIGLVLAVLWFLIWRNRLKWGGLVILAAALPGLWLYSPPDILFSQSGNLFLIHNSAEEIFVSTMRRDRFERKKWQLLYGRSEFRKITPYANTTSLIKCDLVGCVYTRKPYIIAFAENWMASGMDCERAHVLLSSEPVNHPCPFPTYIIDRFDLWRSGTHALYFEEEGNIRIDTVNSLRGTRPWVPLRYQDRILK
ncbi:MAG: ComEC/Rec2 family competence protein [Sneathiella sp.]|nr:ComEC/Rec2 family competence protein [Sneathiella sp.]